MKAINLRRSTLPIAVLAGFLFTLVAQAAQMVVSDCSKRPLSDFLDAQGSTSIFFPPVGDMLGWTDLEFVTFGLVDYAGLASEYLESLDPTLSLGTEVEGRVLECVRKDGTIEISVVISTRNALGFAQSVQDIIDNDFDFLSTPTIFGAKAQDVAVGAVPALGPVQLRTTFTIDNPGDPLPDIRIAFQEQVADFAPITLDFRSTTVGTLPDGSPATLTIQQVAATDESGEELVFTREIVTVR